MTKVEMIKAVAARVNEKYLVQYDEENKPKPITKAQVELILDSYVAMVCDELPALDEKDKLPLPGLGGFKKVKVGARSGVANGVAWEKPEHYKLVFKPLPAFKEV